MIGEPEPGPPARIYDKGHDRFKHVGKTAQPEIVFQSRNPKYKIGLCPNTVPDDTKQALLDEAIIGSNGDRELSFPKRLFVVHEGAIYRAETTDWGRSYHAYPFAGKLGKTLLAELAAMADREGTRAEFDKWVDLHIEHHGK